jgi:hypothetical protein
MAKKEKGQKDKQRSIKHYTNVQCICGLVDIDYTSVSTDILFLF